MRSTRTPYAVIVAVALGCHVAAALLLFRLSLWTDEASSVWFARESLRDLITQLCDPHPPGYYMLLHLWMRVSDSEAWLRLLSLLASLGTLWVVYRWAKAWLGNSVALWATVLLALQPMQVWYSAEVRMYATVQLLTLAAAYTGWRLWQHKTVAWPLAISYWLLATLALWTDYTAVFSLGMLQLLWIASRYPLDWRWPLLNLLVGLPTAALWLLSGQLAALGSSYQPVFVATRLAQLGVNLTLAQTGLLLQVIVIVTGLLGLAIALRWRTMLAAIGTQRVSWLLLGLWIGLLLVTSVPSLFTVKRLLLGLLPWGALLAGWALAGTSKRGWLVPLLPLCLLVMLATHQKTMWRDVVAQLAVSAETGTTIWVDELAIPPFAYYSNDTAFWQIAPLTNAQSAGIPITLVSDDNPYRDVLTLLPDTFFQQHALASDDTSQFGVRQVSFEPRTTNEPAASAPSAPAAQSDWAAAFPSPLASCR